MINKNDIISNKYGRLEVVIYAWNKGYKHYYWCLCDCGEYAIIMRNHLLCGNTNSCGCLEREKTRQRFIEMARRPRTEIQKDKISDGVRESWLRKFPLKERCTRSQNRKLKNEIKILPDAGICKEPSKRRNKCNQGRPPGTRLSQATKDKIATARRGTKRSLKTRKRVMKVNLNKSHSKVNTNREINPNGTEFVDKRGYTMIYMGNGEYIRKSRLVAEQILGRKLKSTETAHHVDGDPSNDDPKNLLVCLNGYHNSLHWRMRKLSIIGISMEGVIIYKDGIK